MSFPFSLARQETDESPDSFRVRPGCFDTMHCVVHLPHGPGVERLWSESLRAGPSGFSVYFCFHRFNLVGIRYLVASARPSCVPVTGSLDKTLWENPFLSRKGNRRQNVFWAICIIPDLWILMYINQKTRQHCIRIRNTGSGSF